MKVAALDDFIEGYINVFDENALIEISTQIDRVDLISFDPTFNNISFKADIVFLFSNPLNDKFKSAKVNVAVRGSTTVELNDKLAFVLKITLDQALVTTLKPFFYSETTKKDFESQFKKKMLPQVLQSFNTQLAKGIVLPLGTKITPNIKNGVVKITEDFIVAEAQHDDIQVINMPAIKKILLLDSNIDTIQKQKYPIVYHVGKDNIVKVLETDSENDDCLMTIRSF